MSLTKAKKTKSGGERITIGYYDPKKKRYVCSMRPTISKALLLEAAKSATKWDYNRQLCDKSIAEIPNRRYKIVKAFPHFHAFFQPVPEHRRIVWENDKGGLSFVDVPMSFFGRVVMDSLKSA